MLKNKSSNKKRKGRKKSKRDKTASREEKAEEPSKERSRKSLKKLFKRVFSGLWLAAKLFFRGLFKAFEISTLRVIPIIGIVGFVTFMGVTVYAMKYTENLPSIAEFEDVEAVESTKIYDRTGTVLLYEIFAEERRTNINLEEIPGYLVSATIAAEDTDFFNHHGINLKSQIRALQANIKDNKMSQGASTITQQLIKNTLLTDEKTIDRKVKEVILSFELERKYSKEEILELYLNQIPYGMNTYGIQAASKVYFNKDAKDLSLAESAVLAALPNRPSHLSPYGKYRDTDLRDRQVHILSQMKKLGMINEEQYNTAYDEDWVSALRDYKVEIVSPHFVFYVQDLLEERALEQGMYGGDLKTAGLKVISTIDLELQARAEEIVKEYSEKNKAYNISNMAMAAVEPNTGHVVTMVGSIDYWDSENDGNVNVTTSYRQPGSSFKPYVYAAAYQAGLGPNTQIYDVKTDFGGGYNPNNYSNNFNGPVTVKTALLKSLNIPAIKAFYVAGAENVVGLANSMGLSNLDPNEAYGLSTALGAKEVRLIDHVAAMSVFGNRGIKVEKTPILQIYDKDGNLIEDNTQPEGEVVLEENVADMINYTLTRNSGSLKIPGHKVAAKTGTSNVNYQGRSYPRDTWTVGWTPNIAIAVWAGNNDGSFLASKAVSTTNAGPAYKAFMIEALNKYGYSEFVSPKITGIRGGGGHSILHYLKRYNDPQYKAWEAAITKDEEEKLKEEEEKKRLEEEELKKKQEEEEQAAQDQESEEEPEEEVPLEEEPEVPGDP